MFVLNPIPMSNELGSQLAIEIGEGFYLLIGNNNTSIGRSIDVQFDWTKVNRVIVTGIEKV